MKDFFNDLLETIAFTLLFFLVIQGSIRNYRVELSSMESTLYPKDRLIVNKLVYFRLDAARLDNILMPDNLFSSEENFFFFHEPERGEIIVFKSPEQPDRDFVKRVVALPGETVALNDGTVFIDGIELEESYTVNKDTSNMRPILVPSNSYFVLGDNRNYSSDSRYWGAIHIKNIIGKVSLRYWPSGDISIFQ